MIRLRTLGPLSLHAADGTEIGSVLAQPKRSALLVYLAAMAPGGFSRRDPLLALFWPELDEEHARGALNKAVHFLRRSLGAEVLLSRGQEELGLNAGLLWCDLWAFDAAVSEERFDEAVELCRGEFLQGLHVSDAPELERWLERERMRQRSRHAAALQRLATEAEGCDDWGAALRRWKELAEVEPLRAEAALGLMRCLARGGDRAGAIQHARAHTARVREELDAEPDPQVSHFAEQLRGASGSQIEGGAFPPDEAPGTPPIPVASGSEDPPSYALAAPGNGDARRAPASPDSGVGHRVGWVAAGLVVIVLGGLFLRPPRSSTGAEDASAPSGARASQSTSDPLIAVLPFAVHGHPDTEYLGDAMVELLSTSLDGAGEIQTANPRSVLNVLRGGSSVPAEIDVGIGARTAEHFGATRFILGDLTVVGRRVRIRAELHRRGNPASLTIATAEGELEDLFSLSDRLAAQLIAGSLELPHRRISRAAALTAPSLPALRAYLDGEREFRAVEDLAVFERATEAFQHAVELDSTFALAQYRLAVAAHWFGRLDVAREATERAFRFREQLGARDQRLLAAWNAGQLGQSGEAERLYRELLLRYPDDPEAHFQLGDLLFRANPLRGRSRIEAMDPVRRALVLDPRNGCARCLMLWLDVIVGGIAEADSLVTGFDPPQPFMERLIAAAVIAHTGDSGARQQLLERLSGADNGELAYTALWVASSGADPPFLRRLFSLLTREDQAPPMHALGEMLRVQLALREGKLHEADRAMRRLQTVDPPLALALRSLGVVHPFRSVPPADLAALAVELSGTPDVRLVPSSLLPDMDPATLARARQYLAGLVATTGRQPLPRDGDFDALSLPPFSSLARADLDARRLLAGNRPREALTALEQGTGVLYEHWAEMTPLLSFTHTRYLRGELLLLAGRDADALKWFRTIGEVPLPDWPYLAPAALRQAQIHERLGDHAGAAVHYRRFIELWSDADAELQPLVDRARAALARLGEVRR